MNEKEQKRYYELGKHYWWLKGKYLLIDKFISLYLNKIKKNEIGNLKLLDFGCGPGNMLDYLIKYGNVYGVDSSLDAIEFCRYRKYKNISIISDLPLKFNNESFDIITAIDVLEHIEDDEKNITELYRLTKQNGLVFITVPAFMLLWGDHDELYFHKRRYLTSHIKNKLIKNNFKILKISYFESIYFIPLLLVGKVKKILRRKSSVKQDDFYKFPEFINKILTYTITWEYYLLKKINMPFGPSIIIVAQKN